ncbi:MAG: ABC transporter ATP-binding protein [Erysipelotrichales bacterium]|nr:ABC transporter ATP-binding protein [Erysipelotrichales bacterium]
MIQLRTVTKAFQSRKVLDELSLTIPKGSVFGLVGPNGSGKSTLLRLLCGVYRLDGGFITYDDQPVYDNVDMKGKIFFVADDPYFFMNSTMAEMKKFYQLFYPNFDEEFYKELIKQFTVSENMKISSMSKGMKRQVILILALAIRPEYLFLDEAFDGLDPMMRLTLKRIISEEIEARNMTVIISSHNLRELEDICDYMGILNNGKILSSGSISEMKSSLMKLQVGIKNGVDTALLDTLDVISKTTTGSVTTLVVRNTKEEADAVILPMNPILYEEIPLKLEEIFVYEMEANGYGTYNDRS